MLYRYMLVSDMWFFFFKQKTAYELRISDWSSDVCSSDLKKFYLDCIKALKPDGMLVQQSESPLLHLKLIQEMHAAMHEAGFVETHLLHFPQVIYPSGWWSGSIACKQAGALNARQIGRAHV